jgi:hypothetical protein
MKTSKEINLDIKKSEILEKIPNIILEGYNYYRYHNFDGDQNLNILQHHAELNNFKYAKNKFVFINNKLYYILCIVNDHQFIDKYFVYVTDGKNIYRLYSSNLINYSFQEI